MLAIKILGVLDIISAVLFWLFIFFNIFGPLLYIVLAYLLAKGAIFFISGNFISILDIISGSIIFAFLSASLPKFIGIIVVLYLVQKGILSML